MAVIGAIAAIASLGLASASAISQASAQRKQIRAQDKAQREAAAVAASEQARAEMEQRRASRKKADPNLILAEQQKAGQQGISSTMLTGSSGVSMSRLKLGQTTLLGS